METLPPPLGISKAKTLDPPTGHGLACKPNRFGRCNACVANSLPHPAPGSSVVHRAPDDFENEK